MKQQNNSFEIFHKIIFIGKDIWKIYKVDMTARRYISHIHWLFFFLPGTSRTTEHISISYIVKWKEKLSCSKQHDTLCWTFIWLITASPRHDVLQQSCFVSSFNLIYQIRKKDYTLLSLVKMPKSRSMLHHSLSHTTLHYR